MKKPDLLDYEDKSREMKMNDERKLNKLVKLFNAQSDNNKREIC